MTSSNSAAETPFPAVLADAATAALENTFAAIFGAKPLREVDGQHRTGCRCVAGTISFVGELTWSLTWVMPQEIAPILAQKFTGFEIPFDSPDMGEMAAELVNVLAGEVIVQLEKRYLKAQMSLPTVTKGDQLEFTPASGPGVLHLDFTSKQGKFWFRLVAASPCQLARHRTT